MRQCTSVTDRRTDRQTDGLASWHKREMYILHLALKMAQATRYIIVKHWYKIAFWLSEWCHLWAHTATGSARNLVRNPSNSALSIEFNGSHVALSQHLLSFLWISYFAFTVQFKYEYICHEFLTHLVCFCFMTTYLIHALQLFHHFYRARLC